MRKSLFLTVALFALPLTAAASAAGGTRLEPIWTLDGFSSPESVALAADGSFLYVSNVNGEGGR